MILAGDIGGTKCSLALFREEERALRPVFQRRFATQDCARFEDLIADFLCQAGPLVDDGLGEKIGAAGFGVAGAVVDGCLHSGNLPWNLDVAALARTLGLEQVVLLNDLTATACGLEKLPSEDVLILNQGNPAARRDQSRDRRRHGFGRSHSLLGWPATPDRAVRRRARGFCCSNRSRVSTALLFEEAAATCLLRRDSFWTRLSQNP